MYRLSHLVLVAAICMGLLVGARAQAPERPAVVPLPEAYFPVLAQLVDTAGKQSSRMIARNAEDAIAEANRMLAFSGQLPNVGGSLQYNPWQRDVRGDVPNPIISQRLVYNLTLTQPVFHWGALRNNTRIGELQLKISQGQTAEVYRLLAQEIRGQFLQLIVRKTTLARARLNRELTDAQVKLAEERLAAQTISSSDLFSARMNQTQVVLAFDRVQEDYEAAKRLLAKLTGTAPLADDQIPDAIPTIAPAMPEMEARLVRYTGGRVEASSNNLKMLDDQIRIEQLSYKNAATRLRPKFNFLTGVSQDLQSYTTNISQKYSVRSYFVGAQVSWSIFDGRATRALKVSSLARRRQLEQNYKTMTDDLIDQARSQLKQLGFSARSMAIGDQYLGLSEGNVKVRQEDLARGTASQADVDSASLSLFDARVNAYGARIDFLLRSAEYLSTLGEDEAAVTFSTPHRS